MGGMAHMDMVYMARMGNILGSGYKGAPRMGHTKGRTKCFPKDSKHTKNYNTMDYTSLSNLSLHKYLQKSLLAALGLSSCKHKHFLRFQ